MAAQHFKLKNGHVITFLSDDEHGFIVRVDSVLELFDLEYKQSEVNHLKNRAMVVVVNGIDYFTGTSFLKFEQENSCRKNVDIIERIVNWMGKNGFGSTYKPSSDLAYHKAISGQVIDLEKWEREMLLLILDVNDHGLRKKLATKIKEVL